MSVNKWPMSLQLETRIQFAKLKESLLKWRTGFNFLMQFYTESLWFNLREAKNLTCIDLYKVNISIE